MPRRASSLSYLRANLYRLIVDALCVGNILVCPKFWANFGCLPPYLSLLSLALGSQLLRDQRSHQKQSHNRVDEALHDGAALVERIICGCQPVSVAQAERLDHRIAGTLDLIGRPHSRQVSARSISVEVDMVGLAAAGGEVGNHVTGRLAHAQHEVVVARPAGQPVGTGSAVKRVVAAAAIQRVVPASSDDPVGEAIAGA